MLPASAEIEHIFLRDQILVDSCGFRLACPRIRRVGIPASMEVLPEQPIFVGRGVLVLGQIEIFHRAARYFRRSLFQQRHAKSVPKSQRLSPSTSDKTRRAAVY